MKCERCGALGLAERYVKIHLKFCGNPDAEALATLRVGEALRGERWLVALLANR